MRRRPGFADLKTELKGDIHKLAERMERNHADFRHAIDTLILTDQAKRLTILKEAVLRTARPSRRPRGSALSRTPAPPSPDQAES